MPNSWKELVPRKKEVKQTRNDYLGEKAMAYNQALEDSKPLYEYVEKLEKALDEIEIESQKIPFITAPCALKGLRYNIIDIAKKSRTEEK